MKPKSKLKMIFIVRDGNFFYAYSTIEKLKRGIFNKHISGFPNFEKDYSWDDFLAHLKCREVDTIYGNTYDIGYNCINGARLGLRITHLLLS